MVFNYRKIYTPSTGIIYTGLHHLPHEQWRSQPRNLGGAKFLILGEKHYFVWKNASQSTKLLYFLRTPLATSMLTKKNRHYLYIYKMFSILLSCHATLCYCVHSHSKLSVTIYQNKIVAFAVALTDTQAKISLKHCFH